MNKPTRIITELQKSEKTTPFIQGMRIVDKGLWWYFMIYAALVAAYWFDFLGFLKELLGENSSNLYMLGAIGYLAILIFLPGWAMWRYKARKQRSG